MDRRTFHFAAWATTLGSLPLLARAQTPRPGTIRLVVPFPPGGGTDIVARLLSQTVAEATGWVFVIDNRAGAGGTLGMDQLAKSAPDGATFGVGQTANLAIGPSLYPRLPYNPLRDFAPVVAIASQPNVLVVRADSPARTLSDLISAARSSAQPMTLGSPGAGTVGHLAGEMLAGRAGFKLLHVPYKGTGPALNDVIAGQIDFVLTTPPGVMSLLRAGKLRALAVTSPKRLAALAAVPTVAEAGFDGFVAEDWKAMLAPAGTPETAIRAMNQAVNGALRNPAVVARLEAEGSLATGGTASDLALLMKAETERWGAAVRSSGARVD